MTSVVVFGIAALALGTLRSNADTIVQPVTFAAVQVRSDGRSYPNQLIGSIDLRAGGLRTNTERTGLDLTARLNFHSAYLADLSMPDPLDYSANDILVEIAPLGPASTGLVPPAEFRTTAISLGYGTTFTGTSLDAFSAGFAFNIAPGSVETETLFRLRVYANGPDLEGAPLASGLTDLVSVSGYVQIAGAGISQVPEPGEFALIGPAAVLLMSARRRR